MSSEYWSNPNNREAARQRLAIRRASGEIVGSRRPGHVVPLEERQKISLSHIGMKASAESRAKNSASHKGIPRLDKKGALSHF